MKRSFSRLCFGEESEEPAAKRMPDFTTPDKSQSFTPLRSLKRALFRDSDDEDFKSDTFFSTPARDSCEPNSSKSEKMPCYTYMKDDSGSKKIKSAVQRLTETCDLIGDGSGVHCLPTINGYHGDLHYVTPQTVAAVLEGHYKEVISGFQILDCRYPYEYYGGHIKGAVNTRTEDDVMDVLRKRDCTTENRKSCILLFYCEFSSERGPKMCRLFRSLDREFNKENYPDLFYPEIYVIHGGYKEFYHSQKYLCEPKKYIPMLHQDYVSELRHFRSKSKPCAVKKRRRTRHCLRF